MEEAKEEIGTTVKPKRSLFRKLLRIVMYVFLTLIGINVLLYILLSIPTVQKAVVDFATNTLKEKLKTEVSIGEIRLRLFNHATIKGIYIEDMAQDTLLYANYLDAKINPWKLLNKNEVAVTGITLDDFIIKINQKDSVSDFNFQFIVDAFSSEDTTAVDTTSSSMSIKITDIRIDRGRLKYDVLSEPETPGIFNASHISLSDFHANIDARSIDTENLNVALNSLTVKDKSGLEISSLSGRIRSKDSKMWAENLILALPNSHLSMKDASYDLKSDQFELSTKSSEIDAQDLLAFMPDLKYLRHNLSLNLKASGVLPLVNVDQLDLKYGNECILNTRASIANFEKYGTSNILLAIDDFKITKHAITDFARIGDSEFVAPDVLDSIGDIHFVGKLQGSLDDFDLDTKLTLKPGVVNLTAQGGIDTTFQYFDVVAQLNTKDFDLAQVLGEEMGIGKFSFSTALEVQQLSKNGLQAHLKGNLEDFEYGKESFKNFYFKANYKSDIADLKLYSNTQIGKLYADASMTLGEIPEVLLKLKMDTFHVDRVYKNDDWEDPRLSLRLDVALRDLDIDKMTGHVNLDSLHLHGYGFDFKPGKFMLTMRDVDKKVKDITLISPIIAANVHGEYKFADLGTEFSNIMHKCMPSVFERDLQKKEHHHSQDFKFSLGIGNTESYSKIFGLPFDLIKPLKVTGEINSHKHRVRFNTDIPKVKFDDMYINNTKLSLANHDSTFHIRTSTTLKSRLNNYYVNFDIDGKADTIRNTLNVERDSVGLGMKGKIDTWAHIKKDGKGGLITTAHFIPSDILFGKLVFNLKKSTLVYADDRLTINDFAINLHDKDFFGIEGAVSPDPTDKLRLFFTHAQLGDVLKGVDINNFAAAANGEVVLANLMGSPEININDFMVYDITVNTDTLGTLSVDSKWSEKPEGLIFDATLQKNLGMVAGISANIPNNNDSIKARFRINEFDIHWLEPFTVGLLTKIEGKISSDIEVFGTNKKPQLKGFLGFNDTSLGVDYTNVVYSVSDTIKISSDYIGFKNLKIQDEKGNTASVNASITHKEYKDVKLDLDMNLKNFMVLNTRHRTDSLFYGRVFASGRVNIKGDKKALDLNVQIRNDKNSSLNILIPQTSEATDYKSVVYINVPVDSTKLDETPVELPPKPASIPVNLRVALDIDKHMTLGVVIDPSTGDAMSMKGEGTINFTYDLTKDIMNTYGRYELSEGNVKLNLQGVKKIEFKMRPNSKLNFVGDPLKTKFDIAAYRRVRADLKTLDYSFESDAQGTKVQVDCDLGIAGDMNKMDLKYGISLPNATDDQKRKVSSLINTEEERIKQFAYLVAMGSFFPSGGGNSGTNFTDGLWTNVASSALSAGLNMALGNVLGDKWEVGTNIDSGDAGTDMSVSVSTRLLDDRLKLNTNLGYRTNSTSGNDNAFIGDFEAEYQLNSTWTVHGYNKTNDRFYRQAPTTQGIGIAYTKDAPTLKKLFQSMRRRRRRIPKIDSTAQRGMERMRLSLDSTKMAMDSIRVQTDTLKFERKIDWKGIEIMPKDSLKKE